MTTRVWALAVGGAGADLGSGQTRPPERTVTPDELRRGAFDARPDWLVAADVLRDSPCYLVPDSAASLEGRVPERLRARAATLRGSWRGPELAWFALRLLVDAKRTYRRSVSRANSVKLAA